jgi:hypothetical protein
LIKYSFKETGENDAIGIRPCEAEGKMPFEVNNRVYMVRVFTCYGLYFCLLLLLRYFPMGHNVMIMVALFYDIYHYVPGDFTTLYFPG